MSFPLTEDLDGTGPVTTAVAKVMKFVRTVTEKLKASNLKEFFVTGENLWTEDANFQEFIEDALSDSAEAPAEEVTYHWHTNTNTRPVHDNVIWPEIGEDVTDLNTKEGRVEARRRLNYLKAEIEKQLKGTNGILSNKGYSNAIGQFKLKSGRVLVVGICWRFAADRRWACFGWHQSVWNAYRKFLSHKGKNKKLAK